jgi:hypothetical protein
VNLASRSATVLIAAAATLGACTDPSDAMVLKLLPADGQLNLATRLPGAWDRVCVLAPYSTDRHARDVLGIDADISLKSRIVYSDSIALLVTVEDSRVAGMFEIPRDSVDFAHLGGECFSRAESRFAVPEAGHPYATHVDS